MSPEGERESCGGGGQAASTFPSMNRDGIIQEIKHEFRAARHVTDEAEVRRLDVTRSCNPPLCVSCAPPDPYTRLQTLHGAKQRNPNPRRVLGARPGDMWLAHTSPDGAVTPLLRRIHPDCPQMSAITGHHRPRPRRCLVQPLLQAPS